MIPVLDQPTHEANDQHETPRRLVSNREITAIPLPRRSSLITIPVNGPSLRSLLPGDRVLGLSGLANLGNTCFMNTCLQCLLNTEPLAYYFVSNQFKPDVNRAKGMKGQLAEAFGDLAHKVWTVNGSVSPSRFKSLIGTWANSFAGYRQHDAQEFLRFVLDGLHEDLNRIQGTPPYKELKDIPGEPENTTSKRWWTAHKARNDSFVVDLFSGQLKSNVTCMKCSHSSKAFDPFMDLSLTLPASTAHGSVSLADCIDKFLAEETLTGSERWT
eukprot:NODE_635_length_1481_cov_36.170391_g472_i0.p1 GENE.NODE_635_length_1481_cov_36.170391_g472_i0~~NODE_635_length_1481_cov_36.170391_g472_i0.p1  ORF type:complete len:271 (-),score=15.96 NODE_635_length_1481_cov_36.170391_g472_i0:261-1073(-)